MDPVHGPREELLQHLIGDGILSASEADDLRTRLRTSWIPIGKILRQRGLLSMEQLVDLLRAQELQPTRRLGDLAVQRGWVGGAELHAALTHQCEASPHLIEVLASEPGIDPQKLLRALARYVRDLERRLSDAGSSVS
jgi:hypothetical protein